MACLSYGEISVMLTATLIALALTALAETIHHHSQRE